MYEPRTSSYIDTKMTLPYHNVIGTRKPKTIIKYILKEMSNLI